MKNFMDMTMTEALETLRGMDAGMTQHIVRDGNGKALAAIIIVDGEEAQEVLDAVNTLTAEW